MSEEWVATTLGELTETTRPICYGVLKPGPFVAGGVPLVRIQDMEGDQLATSGYHRISDDLDEEFRRSRLRGGEVLLSIQGTVGRVALCPPELAGANISRTVAVIEPDARLITQFLRLYLQLVADSAGFDDTGSTRASLNISTIRAMQVPVPPLPVQRRIVDLMTSLDAHIANLQAERDALSSVLRNYRLVTFTGITGEWPTVRLGDTVESLDSMRRPVKSADRVSGPYPYYGASGVVDFVSDWIFEGQTLLVSEDGANLRARSSPIAFCADGRYWVNNHAHVLRALDITTNDYLAQYLECTDIDLALTGTTMPKLNAANLLRIEVPLPPLSMQRDLTETLERLSASITASQCESQRLEELRTALLEGLLVGSTEIPSDYDSLLLGEVA
jgi:type I restriction enzyme S subunit